MGTQNCYTMFTKQKYNQDHNFTAKTDMENDSPTTWYEESGLIAHEVYYDAPELLQSTHRGKPGLDEEGNDIPLPEIQTSMDPQPDPDYSSWGKDPASVN